MIVTRRGDLKKNLTILVVGTLLFFTYACDAESKRQLEILQQFASGIPRYQDFNQVDTFQSHKPGMAMMVISYASSATLEEVTKFYSQTMQARGWTVVPKEQRTRTIFYSDDVVFRKDDYWLGIKKDEQAYKGGNYVVAFYWEHN